MTSLVILLMTALLLSAKTPSKGVTLSGTKELLNGLAVQQVKFYSVNYRNILAWKPTLPSNKNQEYFVQYKIYGDKSWTNVSHCQGIQELFCDMSQEMSDPRERYYARVQAVVLGHLSPWVLSPRFSAHWETSVGAPALKLSVREQGIVVRLKPPMSPYRRRGGSWISVRKLQSLIYRVYLISNDTIQETYELEACVTELVIANLLPQTTYCMEAESHLQRLGRTGARGPRACITTP